MTQVFTAMKARGFGVAVATAAVLVLFGAGAAAVHASNDHNGFNGGFNNGFNGDQNNDHNDGNNGGQCTYGDNHNFHHQHHGDNGGNGNGGNGDNGNGSTTPDTLTIEKDTTGGDGSFTFNVSGPSAYSDSPSVTTTGGSGSTEIDSLSDGTYTITENVPDGWTLTDMSCEDSDSNTVSITPTTDGGSINLADGADVTCAFSDTMNPVTPTTGSIAINKDTTGGDGTFPFSVTGPNEFSDSPSITTTDGSGATTENTLDAGTYTITENVPSGWTFNSASCEIGDTATGTSVTNGVSVDLASGENVTCTFNDTMNAPTPTSSTPPVDNVVLGNTGTHGVSGGNTPGGKVLGAEIGPTSCVPPLTTYLRQGNPGNTVSQVEALQTFLNKFMGDSLPVTGFFGPMTTSAVNAFQLKYDSDVLAPWAAIGLGQDHKATGWEYKLTEWKINTLACPDNSIPAPTLP